MTNATGVLKHTGLGHPFLGIREDEAASDSCSIVEKPRIGVSEFIIHSCLNWDPATHVSLSL